VTGVGTPFFYLNILMYAVTYLVDACL
jgi:hypothetical protein